MTVLMIVMMVRVIVMVGMRILMAMYIAPFGVCGC